MELKVTIKVKQPWYTSKDTISKTKSQSRFINDKEVILITNLPLSSPSSLDDTYLLDLQKLVMPAGFYDYSPRAPWLQYQTVTVSKR